MFALINSNGRPKALPDPESLHIPKEDVLIGLTMKTAGQAIRTC
jgi:hypothetical protein